MSGSTMSAHVGWNGAIEVAAWRVLAGDAPKNMQPVTDAKKDGFETRIDLPEAKPHLKVQALDDMGAVIGESQPVAVKQSRRPRPTRSSPRRAGGFSLPGNTSSAGLAGGFSGRPVARLDVVVDHGLQVVSGWNDNSLACVDVLLVFVVPLEVQL